MANFAEIASKRLADIERPPVAPVGMYRWQVTKIPTTEQISNGAYTQITFPVKAIEAYESVDADDLRKFGGIKNVVASVRFLYDNNDETKGAQTEFRIRTFLEKHLQVEGVGAMTLAQAMAATLNCQCDGEFSHRPDPNDREIIYGEIRKTAPVRE